MTTTVTITVPTLVACRDGDTWWALARDGLLTAVGRGASRHFAFAEALFNLAIEEELSGRPPRFDVWNLDSAIAGAATEIAVWSHESLVHRAPRNGLLHSPDRSVRLPGAQAVAFVGGDGGRAFCAFGETAAAARALVIERLRDGRGTEEEQARALLDDLGVVETTYTLGDGQLFLHRAHGGFAQTFRLAHWNPRALRRAVEQELERRRALQ